MRETLQLACEAVGDRSSAAASCVNNLAEVSRLHLVRARTAPQPHKTGPGMEGEARHPGWAVGESLAAMVLVRAPRWSQVLRYQGKFGEAEPLQQQAVRLSEDIMGKVRRRPQRTPLPHREKCLPSP